MSSWAAALRGTSVLQSKRGRSHGCRAGCRLGEGTEGQRDAHSPHRFGAFWPRLSGQDELLCTYAALVLHDDGAEITPAAMTDLIKAAGCSVEAYWPLLMVGLGT